MPRFIIHQGREVGRVFEIAEGRPTSIGRAKSSNLVLDDPTVSRLHAVLLATPDGQWQIVDRSNSNGLKINGRVTQESVLHTNDEVLIGPYRLCFEDSATRNIMSYGTARLPEGVDRLVNGSFYSSSLLPVEPVGNWPVPKSAEHSATAERLRLVEDENRLLKVLYRASRMLGEIEVEKDLLRRILDLSLEIEGSERGYAMLLDENANAGDHSEQGPYEFQPAIIRYRNPSADLNKRATPQLTISRTIIRQVMHSGLPLLVADGHDDPRFVASHSVVNSVIQSAMCAPLGIGKRARGLLYIDNLSKSGMFTLDHLNVFAVIAVQAGLAIDRLRGQVAVPQPVLH
jgi:hypothetical protein